MRNRFLFLGLSASVITGAAAFLACSGDTESTSSTDAGADTGVVDSGSKDSAADATDSAPPCDTSKNFITKIPDASIADGASTTGACAACVQTKCSTEVDKCNKDCVCQGLADKALTCYAQANGDFTAAAACVGDFAGAPAATQKIGFALVGCVNDNCKKECAIDALIGDAGADG
jgi:hypothetical protein